LREVLWAFRRLGLTSFDGPIAYLGYFHAELVTCHRWLDEATYTDLVPLCQFLPVPVSSQLGNFLGLLRAGLPGALAAWVDSTPPSAVVLTPFGYGVGGAVTRGAG
jgi:chromate transporter